MINKIKQIASENPYGFTIYTTTLQHVSSGWVVALKETQNSFGDEGLKKVWELAKRTTGIMGGWKDGKLFYWDCVMIVDNEAEAIRLGIENEQLEIYHLDTGKQVRL